MHKTKKGDISYTPLAHAQKFSMRADKIPPLSSGSRGNAGSLQASFYLKMYYGIFSDDLLKIRMLISSIGTSISEKSWTKPQAQSDIEHLSSQIKSFCKKIQNLKTKHEYLPSNDPHLLALASMNHYFNNSFGPVLFICDMLRDKDQNPEIIKFATKTLASVNKRLFVICSNMFSSEKQPLIHIPPTTFVRLDDGYE